MTDPAPDSTSLLTRFMAISRPLRWALAAVFAVALFLAWDSTIGATVDRWNGEADRIEGQALAVRRGTALGAKLRRMHDAIVALGPVAAPMGMNDGRAALTNAVVEVLGDSAVTSEFALAGGADKLPLDASRRIVRPGHRIGRLTGSLKFESPPEKAIGVIGRFERRPDIDGIRKVTIARSDSRGQPKVKVTLTLEKWVEIASSRRQR